ncbi:hypothetical protein [Streptomyces phaeolivaceus]|uniref:hypothetical protein n=1 Tax=Streptomyces phaeolivaceus TaxID=2653200 RepID=UPI001D04D6F2|nr:hypothetical protein [Streptomyces phaeolivaceus]
MTGLALVAGMLVVLGAVPAGYAAEPDPATSWAGSRAGEGRERPGRQDAGPLEPEDDGYPPPGEPTLGRPDGPDAGIAPEPSRPVPAAPPGTGTATAEEPVLQFLTLGSGLVLTGLGLGLAFVGLRIRRY